MSHCTTIDWQPEQPGDVPQTWASVEKARQLLGYAPKSTFNEGIVKFAKWLGGTDAGGLAPPRGLPT